MWHCQESTKKTMNKKKKRNEELLDSYADEKRDNSTRLRNGEYARNKYKSEEKDSKAKCGRVVIARREQVISQSVKYRKKNQRNGSATLSPDRRRHEHAFLFLTTNNRVKPKPFSINTIVWCWCASNAHNHKAAPQREEKKKNTFLLFFS